MIFQVKVALRVSMSLVDLVCDLQPDVEQDGLSLEVVKGERRLHINRDLQLEFSNDTVQVNSNNRLC